MDTEKIDRPKNDKTPGGKRIFYPIWRADLAEATILEKENEKSRHNEKDA